MTTVAGVDPRTRALLPSAGVATSDGQVTAATRTAVGPSVYGLPTAGSAGLSPSRRRPMSVDELIASVVGATAIRTFIRPVAYLDGSARCCTPLPIISATHGRFAGGSATTGGQVTFSLPVRSVRRLAPGEAQRVSVNAGPRCRGRARCDGASSSRL